MRVVRNIALVIGGGGAVAVRVCVFVRVSVCLYVCLSVSLSVCLCRSLSHKQFTTSRRLTELVGCLTVGLAAAGIFFISLVRLSVCPSVVFTRPRTPAVSQLTDYGRPM